MRKLVFVIFVSLTFLLSYSGVSTAYENEIRSLSNAMADNIAKAGKKRIAVVDFTDLQGNITELGRFIAEEMSVDFTMTAKGFEVIDRNHLNRILAEHKLSISGIVDQKTVQKLGQIAGVDAIVTGSITPLENSVRVVCKVIATDTARVISAGKGDIAKTKAIEDLLGKGIRAETTTPTSKPQPKTLLEVNVDNFIFKAKLCQARGQKVSCTISVINDEPKTRELWIFVESYGEGRSLMVDNLGNQYKPVDAKFGTVGVNSWVMSPRVTSEVPPQISMNLELFYDEVVPEAKYVSIILDVKIGGLSGKSFKPMLRNIPLSR